MSEVQQQKMSLEAEAKVLRLERELDQAQKVSILLVLLHKVKVQFSSKNE